MVTKCSLIYNYLIKPNILVLSKTTIISHISKDITNQANTQRKATYCNQLMVLNCRFLILYPMKNYSQSE